MDDQGNEKIEVDFGIGKISFGGLFKGLGSLIELAAKLKDEEEIKKVGEIKGLPKNVRGVYGLSVRTLGGKPVIETFGNIKETEKGPVVEEIREPLVDVFDENEQIIVIAELPGASEQAIEIGIKGDILELRALGAERKYAKEILLPAPVDPLPARKAYKNGILEITLKKSEC